MTRLTLTLTVLSAGLVLGAAEEKDKDKTKKEDPLHPRVKLETTLGDIVLELDGEKAPITTLNFIDYGKAGYYDGTIFHRVIENFVIQGGGYTTEGKKTEGLRAPIENEWRNALENERGTISMARLGGRPDSATSQFFINLADNKPLDQPRDGAAYAVFGRVVEGMDVVDKIGKTEVAEHAVIPGGQVPTEPIVVKSVKVVGAFDRDKIAARVKEAEKAQEAAVGGQMKEAIQKAEKETGKKAERTDSGLAYIVIKAGEGPSPEPTDVVEVHYTGWLTDGTKFDSSVDRGQPATFPLNRVIGGWTEGVSMMKVGGKRKLVLPPELGYGEAGFGNRIPPNSVLVFEVELLSIKENE